jgi:hypothetical protein
MPSDIPTAITEFFERPHVINGRNMQYWIEFALPEGMTHLEAHYAKVAEEAAVQLEDAFGMRGLARLPLARLEGAYTEMSGMVNDGRVNLNEQEDTSFSRLGATIREHQEVMQAYTLFKQDFYPRMLEWQKGNPVTHGDKQLAAEMKESKMLAGLAEAYKEHVPAAMQPNDLSYTSFLFMMGQIQALVSSAPLADRMRAIKPNPGHSRLKGLD